MIIATASHLSSNLNIIQKMILAGCDVLRFNFSYGTFEFKSQIVNNAKSVIDDLNADTKIFVDLPSPKVRLGNFPQKKIAVKEGDIVTLASAESSEQPEVFLPVQYPEIGNFFYPEQTIIIDEGEISLKVLSILSSDSVQCMVLNTGKILSYKGLNWANQSYDLLEHIQKIGDGLLPKMVALEPDYISCPLVNNQQIAEKYTEKFNKINWSKKPKLVFKVETKEAIKNLEQIIPLADVILLERGNLGINAPFERIGIYQQYVTNICKKHKKPIVIATQILESAIYNLIPKRSEISDLTNMVFNNIDGIILSHETGVSMRPAYSISIAKRIITEAENFKRNNKI